MRIINQSIIISQMISCTLIVHIVQNKSMSKRLKLGVAAQEAH